MTLLSRKSFYDVICIDRITNHKGQGNPHRSLRDNERNMWVCPVPKCNKPGYLYAIECIYCAEFYVPRVWSENLVNNGECGACGGDNDAQDCQ